jgi:hypothetical protein
MRTLLPALPRRGARPLAFHARFGLAVLLAAAALAAPVRAKQVLPRRGGEIPVNTTTALAQLSPAVAADAQGDFVVVWLGPDEAFNLRVYARLFGAGGAPRSPEIVINEALGSTFPRSPRVAMDAAGRFAVAWFDDHVQLRRFDAQGAPLGAAQRVDEGVGFATFGVDVAMEPAGSFVVAWLSGTGVGAIYARRFDPQGAPLEPARRLDVAAFGMNQVPRVAASAGGGFLVTWPREKRPDFLSRSDEIVARRAAGAAADWTPEQKLNSGGADVVRFAVPAFHPDGGFSVVWQSLALAAGNPGQLFPRAFVARRFDAGGAPQGLEVALPFAPETFEPAALAADPHGNSFVVVSGDISSKPQGRLFDSQWRPLGEPFAVPTFADDAQREPAVAAAGEGFAAVWTSGPEYVLFPPFAGGQDGNLSGIFGQVFAPPLCAPGAKVLCLGPDGRFELTVDWKTPDGDSGQGRALPVTGGDSGDTGSFWFFGDSNLELLTKVLDGRAVNGSFWVFSGALSNVDYILHVTDTASGARRDYHNAQGQLASRADTSAFPASGDGGQPPAPGIAAIPTIPAGAADGALCPDNADALCFASGRLAVEVSFVDPRGGGIGQGGPAGQGHPAGLTADTGTFWFFTPGNLELAVKVLDGGAVNGFFWLFSAGMSNLDYTIKVTDRTTGAVKTYHNAPGELASRADTRLFPSPR